MDHIQIDLTTIVTIWMGGAILLVPLLGLVARWAVIPLLDSVARLRAAGDASTAADLQHRLIGMERRLADLARAVDRLEAADRMNQRFEVGR